MDKYQKYVIDNIKACLVTDSNFEDNKPLSEFLDGEENLVITQDENYNIKTRYLLLEAEIIDYIELDDKRINTNKGENKNGTKFVIVPFDFDNRVKKLTLHLSNDIADSIALNVVFSEVDHKIFDTKVQEELNAKIKPEHNTGNDLVNIYWNLVSDDVEITQINLYFKSTSSEERLVAKYKEKDTMFKSITGLAFGTYYYEIIELDKDNKELARTNKITFHICRPDYCNTIEI